VQVGGLIAAVGSRLVDAAAKKLADDFFHALSVALTEGTEGTG
jgi:carbon monoxide dehydrogenase subunit G